ncbi:MAG: hypothetical protein Q7V58_08250 [Actinomycetota bacterium]|nr:hypothetical protein [Actinomycetota bacterium]
MSMIGGRRRPGPGAASDVINPEVSGVLRSAAAKGFTGSIDVTDRLTRGTARLFMYEGGLYAVELPGYVPPVAARLGVSDAPAAEAAVAAGAVSIGALAAIHQEFVIASLGAVLALPRARTHLRKGQTSARFCTLPLPVDPLFDLVRMRADRLAGTWAMLATDANPATTVALRGPVAGSVVPRGEAFTLLEAVDGIRTLDGLAAAAGFTRAEAVHLASVLVDSGHVVLADEHLAGPTGGPLLVPEEFGTRVPDPVAQPSAATQAAGPSPWSAAAAVAAAAVAAVPPTAEEPLVDDLSERKDLADLDPVDAARAAVIALVDELQDALRAEQAAVERTAEVSRRLREARAAVDGLESGVPAPAT